MASLDSDKVRHALKSKLGCKENPSKDHIWFLLRDDKGKLLAKTKVSHGPKHQIGDILIRLMARQIMLGTSANFVGMVDCTKSREDCLEIIKKMCQ